MVESKSKENIENSDYKIKGNARSGLLGSTLGFFIGFAGVVALGSTIGIFKSELVALGISDAMIGLLVAMPNLSGSLLRIPFAAWSDSAGGRKPMLILLIMALFGMAGLVLVGMVLYPLGLEISHYYLLLLFGFLAGGGIATFSVGISQTSYWFPKDEQGKALGTYAGVGNLAPGIFSLVMTVTLTTLGLGGSYIVWFVLLSIGASIYGIIGRNAWSFQLVKSGVEKEKARELAQGYGQEIFSENNLSESLIHSAKIKETWGLVGLYFTSFGGFIGLSAWYPTYWASLHSLGEVDIAGISISISLILNSIFIIIGSLMRVFSGNWADKTSGYHISIIGSALITVMGIFLAIPFNSITISFIGMIILAIGMGIMNAGVFKIVPQVVPDSVGGAAGWIGGLGAFGGFVIPPILGYFVDIFGNPGYNYGLIVFLILGGFSLIILLILRRNRRNSGK